MRLSPSPCLRRVRRLEDSGVIAGYRAVIDPAAVDLGFQVLIHVTMEAKDRLATMEAFEARVAEIDEVIECRRMFGDPDYLLWVAAAELPAFEQLYISKLVGLPGVARTVSQLTMKTVKPGGRSPSSFAAADGNAAPAAVTSRRLLKQAARGRAVPSEGVVVAACRLGATPSATASG